ncbi:MAG: LPS assembly lipoprotein LptE [Bacteroidaceae bacterium]|nr:LPS assembly lipoprotein LptE [Bacteroidaceae bacterium]
MCFFRKFFLLLTALCLLASCMVSYKLNGASIDYNTVKTIMIDPFANRAAYQWAPMTAMFNESISDLYVRQTKLKQVKSNGDLVISGEITGYDQINKSISADGFSSMIELKMTVKVRFVNNTNHKDDFERSFSAAREYNSKQQLSSVQEELVQQMIDEINDQIFNATVANW